LSIVWPCALDLRTYVQLGQLVEVGEHPCTGCGKQLTRWADTGGGCVAGAPDGCGWIGLVGAWLPARLGVARTSDDSLNAGELWHAAGPRNCRHWRVRRARLGSQQSLSSARGRGSRRLAGAHGVVFSLARVPQARLTLLTRRRLLKPVDQFCQAAQDHGRGWPERVENGTGTIQPGNLHPDRRRPDHVERVG
jgi:hypothetical protein